MQKYLIKNISVVNEGNIYIADVLIDRGRIERVDKSIGIKGRAIEINGEGKHLLPGVIDDQVHFREPGLTHKADIYTESKAAVAGGVTSFMEMPNTVPNTLTGKLLEEKYNIAAHTSLANYSFFMGVSNDNADEVLRLNDRRKDICGVKIFMGSSTGNMLVDSEKALDRIFMESGLLIATHCEDEKIIRRNYEVLKANKETLGASDHPIIRDEEACYQSSSRAVALAKKYDSRLHVLHISTAKELELFDNALPLKQKRITAEVCVHHLHFTSADYDRLGYLIKCNPAIKQGANRDALWQGLFNNNLDVIATDHAPHTLEEKGYFSFGVRNIERPYEQAASGIPLVQHSLLLMLRHHAEGKITLEKIAEKMSHAVADCFKIQDRGYIREGYHADLVIADLNAGSKVTEDNILYKCQWSPFTGETFNAAITHTFISGNCVYGNGEWNESQKGQRLQFY